jgi:hypothetical protein
VYLSVSFLIPDERRLRQAVSTNNVDQVAALLGSGVNPNCVDHQHRSPLHLAACRGYCDIVRSVIWFPSLSILYHGMSVYTIRTFCKNCFFNFVYISIKLQHFGSWIFFRLKVKKGRTETQAVGPPG